MSVITWKDVGQTVGKAAPLIGSLLGGPMGAAAGSLVASALGVEASPGVVNTAAADPNSLIRIRELEVKERSELLGWYTEQLRLEVEDRKSARDASVKGGDRKPLLVLSLFLFCVVFGLEGMVMFMQTTPGMPVSTNASKALNGAWVN